VNALRGHSNIQGLTDLNAYAEVFSGYLSAPTDNDDSYEKYLKRARPSPCGPTSSTTGELPALLRQPDEVLVRQGRHAREQLGYDWCPSWTASTCCTCSS
jgi:formate dehydrogenase major subunit